MPPTTRSEKTLTDLSTTATATASCCAKPKTWVSRTTIAISTKPKPAGVSGTAVRSEDALGDDDADRPRQRDAEAPLHQVGAVQITELGRDDGVHEPAQHQDHQQSRAAWTPLAALRQQQAPAPRTQRERGVVDGQRREQEPQADRFQRRSRVDPID